MQNTYQIAAKSYELTKLVESNATNGKLPYGIGGSLNAEMSIEIKTKDKTGDLIVTVFVAYDETIRRVSVIPYDRDRLIATIQDMINPVRLAHLAQEAIAIYQNRITSMASVMVNIIAE
jgi:hypothetical protein